MHLLEDVWGLGPSTEGVNTAWLFCKRFRFSAEGEVYFEYPAQL
jgi:hypothetical protein